ncbi:uncharacterized protein LOC127807004 isoform X3 [Diospyros lotus]|uniref:uncharacterized protein LOC127807004 isoform X3 n=2 Tax=Diospyros lotus TaxID=55363 RepID=UPI00225B6364|nr:uncharacterized protein LOC127807004 isoform X3 [Diospyros lotus]
MATSSSLSFEVFPCPVYVNVEDSVHIKLSRPNYFIWRKMMSDFLERQYLIGFINGMIKRPPALIAVDEQSACRGKEIENPDHISWKRTDELVQKWLRITIQDDILRIVADLKTAYAIWRVLEDTFINPSADYMEYELMLGETSCREAGINIGHYFPLYQAVQEGDWERVKKFLEKEPDAIKARINTALQTPLMVAVKSPHRNKVVKGLLDRMSKEDLEQFEHKKEKTVLHKAVGVGNIKAAKMLVNKNDRLPYICGDSGVVPLRTAARRANREMVSYLLSVTKEDIDPRPFLHKLGFKLIDSLIIGGLYDIALMLIRRHPELAVMDSGLLDSMALKPSAFQSGLAFNFCQRFIYSHVPIKLENSEKLEKQQCGGDIESLAQCSTPVKLRMRLQAMVWKVAEIFVPQIKRVREKKQENQDAVDLVKFLCTEVGKLDHLKAKDMLKVPLSTAACAGIREVVEEILHTIPGSTHLRSAKKSVFHLAVLYRREQVFNLIYQHVGSTFRILSHTDMMGNNGLHMAGYLYPQQLLNLRSGAAGAALQMQLELQWFKEVEKFVLPQAKEARNYLGKTPAEAFTETHKILVKEGEQWMKDAANSCTIVAALVATVAFAAAITVPGGNNGVTGQPLFSKETAFAIFAIADALALFSSSSSLLMFLSILTSRYAEEDFLYALPNRLIIGLITLFLSILSMMAAFVSTLYLVFAAKDTWILIPVVVLACLPVTLFVSLQFPLLIDMIISTYGPGIFGKQSNRYIT